MTTELVNYKLYSHRADFPLLFVVLFNYNLSIFLCTLTKRLVMVSQTVFFTPNYVFFIIDIKKEK